MSTVELRKRLIDIIQVTDDLDVLEEIYRLLSMETESLETYKMSDDQRKNIHEAREQFKNGNFLNDEQANKDIDEWLKE